MSNVKNIAKNSAVLFGGSILNRIFEIVSILLLTEFLSVGQFGYYRVIFAYFGLWALVIDLGVSGILIREGARDRKHALEYIYNGFAIGTMVIVGVVGISYLIMTYVISYPDEVKNLFWYGIFSVVVSSRFKSYRMMFEVLFIIDFKVIYPTVFKVLDRIIFMGCLYVFIRHTQSLPQAVLFTVLVDSLGFILLILAYIKHFKVPRFSFNMKQWKFLLGESWPTLFSGFVNVINIRISILIMTALLTAEEVGIYGFAALIAESIGFIPAVIVKPIFPVLSQKYVRSLEVFYKVYRVTVKYLLIIIFPVVTYLFIELDEIVSFFVSLFLKEAFLLSVPAAKILIFAEIFIFGFAGYNKAIIASNKQIYSLLIISISMVCTIVLNLLLIPKYGMYGAAYSTVISLGIYIITGLFFPKIRTLSKILIQIIGKLIIVSVTTGVIVYYLNTNMWISLIVCVIMYVAILLVMKVISKEDLEIFYEAFPTRFVRWLIACYR